MKKQRVLILTGRLCSKPLQELIDSGEGDVIELPIEVAALMNPGIIGAQLRGLDLSEYEYVMLPGSLKFDLEMLEKRFGLPFYLGPTHYLDIPVVMKNIDMSQLSKTLPADLVMKDMLRTRTRDFYNSAVPIGLESEIILGRGTGSVPIGGKLPPRVVGEIVDAPSKNVYDILTEAKYMARSGASIIDIGMVPGIDHVDFIDMVVPLIKRDLGMPVSIDTMSENEIFAAADSGVDLILSICGSTLGAVPSLDVPVVIVPLESPDSARPSEGKGRLEMLSRFADQLDDHAIIADPLLEPVGLGFSGSVKNYIDLKEHLPSTPSLMGVGNVTELVDADSIGMNALLAGIATETNVSLLLTTENSAKTQGGVGELRTACQMMYYAKEKGVPPKNLGLDLLKLKEKVHREYPVKLPREKILSSPSKNHKTPLEDRIFHIAVLNSQIHVICRDGKREVDIIGKEAEAIANELDRQGILPEPRHALYLGNELKKAEMALRLRRGYMQDMRLFEEDDDNGKDQD